MASFYIFLPSNSDINNLIGRFKVKLPETIRLEGDWEVSMREFNYTRLWMNIGSIDDAMVHILNFPDNSKPSQVTFYVKYNDYDTPQKLIDAIKYAVKEYSVTAEWGREPIYKLYFDEQLRRCVIKVYEKQFYIIISEKMAYMLGFDTGKINKLTKSAKDYQINVAQFPPDMNASMYALMVHCDLVAPQLVGHTYANLLRMVPVSGRFNENINTIYNDEQYVPVMQKTFDSIEININDDAGKIVNFQFGRTFLTLHFRKRRRWVV